MKSSKTLRIFLAALMVCVAMGGMFGSVLADDSSPESAPAPKESKSKNKKSIVNGSVMQDYRWQTTGGQSNNIIETLVTMNIGDPTMHRYSGSIQAGVVADLNYNAPNSYFRNIYDTFPYRVAARFYSGYLDINKVPVFNNIRVGRQHLYELENLNFDGVSFESKAYSGFVFSFFGGAPVHLYENEYGVLWGDWTAGGALQWTPIARLRLRASVVHLHDQLASFFFTPGKTSDTLFGISAWLDITKNWELYSRLTAFADQVRDWDFSSSTQFPAQDLKIIVNVHRLVEAYVFRVDDWDPYSLAGAYEPYTEVQAQIYKGLGKKFSINLGGGARILDNYQIASAYNHGYERVFGTLSSHDFLIKGLSAALTANYYHGEDNVLQNNYFALTFMANQELLKKRLKIGAGTNYYLYQYNLLTGNESNNVRTYFADVEGKLMKNLKLKASYVFEQNAINGFHSGRVRAIWDF